MEPTTNQQNTEDKDVNCRLRHGLNVHCLANIFQHLDTQNLHTVGEMNVVHNQIIKDLVIRRHCVHADELIERDIAEQFFQKYGTKIQQIDMTTLSNCDWTKLVNLTELELFAVRGINTENFIEFLRQRPSLEVFHNYSSFEDSTEEKIFEIMGIYCGDKIRNFLNENFNFKLP